MSSIAAIRYLIVKPTWRIMIIVDVYSSFVVRPSFFITSSSDVFSSSIFGMSSFVRYPR